MHFSYAFPQAYANKMAGMGPKRPLATGKLKPTHHHIMQDVLNQCDFIGTHGEGKVGAVYLSDGHSEF